jgi:hypothetical protein
VALGRVGIRFGRVRLDKFDKKKLLDYGSDLDRFGPNRVGFQVEHYRFFSGFGSFRVGSGRVSGSYELILGFGSFRSGSDRVSDHLISSNLGF